MDVRIRMAESSDGQRIAGLLRSLKLFAHINEELVQATQERIAKHIAISITSRSHAVSVAHTTPGVVVGYGAVHWLPYLCLAGPEGYVSELFVVESYRGQRIGSRMLEAIKAEAQEYGCSRLMLVNLQNRESYQRQFYSKQGWKERKGVANFVYCLSHE